MLKYCSIQGKEYYPNLFCCSASATNWYTKAIPCPFIHIYVCDDACKGSQAAYDGSRVMCLMLKSLQVGHPRFKSFFLKVEFCQHIIDLAHQYR